MLKKMKAKKKLSLKKVNFKKKPKKTKTEKKVTPEKKMNFSKKSKKVKNNNLSIKAKLMIFSLILSVVPILIVGGFSYTRFHSTIEKKVGGLTEQLSTQNALILDSKLEDIEKAAMLVKSDRELQKVLATRNYANQHEKLKDTKKVEQVLWNVILSTPDIRSITVLRLNGEVISAGNNKDVAEFLKDGKFTKTDLFKDVSNSKNQVFWTPGLLGHYDKIHAMREVSDYYNIRAGIVILEIETKTVEKLFSNINMGEGSELLIAGKDGTIIYGEEGVAEEKAEPAAEGEEAKEAAEESSETQTKVVDEEDAEMNNIFTANIPEDSQSGSFLQDDGLVAYSKCANGWTILSVIPMKSLMGDVNQVGQMTITIAIVCVIVSVLLSIYITFSITNPLKKIMGLMTKVQEGDLTVKSDLVGKNEIGRLSTGFNHMIDSMRNLIKDTNATFKSVENSTKNVDDIAEQYTMVSEQVAVSVGEIANGASEQARSAEDATNTMSQLSNRIDNMVHSIKVVHEATDKTKEISNNATNTVKSLYEKTEEYAQISGATKETITQLKDSVSEIINIVDLIKSISDQTNLLALNAAIEAARSGEAGKGFAVVADEIRKLAEQSKDATNKITDLANEINTDVTSTVQSVEAGEKIFGEQHLAVFDTDSAFKNIIDSVESIVQEVNEVGKAVEDITEYKNMTIDAVESIAAVTEESAAGTEEVMASTQQQASSSQQLRDISKELIDLVESLNQSMDRFKVDE
ncbi:methyl-accepting chemotaxis protein [Wukongibacter baidiensis]|uniref:methyl-accepting chemotaxis protein n=1 Tax=Wukongibacter baidiensis TaxID=1723361 RepID=UPI003D7FCC4D